MPEKRFGPERPAPAYVPLFEELHAQGLAPRLREVRPDGDSWIAAFEFVAGEQILDPVEAVPLLKRLALSRAPALLDLPEHWLKMFDAFAWYDGPAELLRDHLRRSMPGAPRVVAHGDFNPQNIVRTEAGLILIDWEEAGRAPIEFDAGWMLAVARINDQVTTRLRALFADLHDKTLRWSFRAGLLRLLMRSRTRQIPSAERAALVTRLRELILEEL